LVGGGLSLVAIAVALYVLRSERAPETERESAERGWPPDLRRSLMKQ
jgi:hypothetical protein